MNDTSPIRTQFYSVKQTSVLLNISEKTVRRLLSRGILRSSKATRKKQIPRSDIETYMERTG